MSRGRKTFVLHKHWIEDIMILNNCQAGALFKNIFNYVNDISILDNMDLETTALYEKIKEQINFEWSKLNPKTKKYHWNYKGGITDENKSIRNSTVYKIWRQKVFERDNFTCKMCGVRGVELNAHHIKSFAKNPKLRTVLSNGTTLCVSCHKKEHSK